MLLIKLWHIMDYREPVITVTHSNSGDAAMWENVS